MPVVSRTMPLVPPLAEMLRKFKPLAPMFVFATVSAVPVVVVRVLAEPVTFTVPPPVAVKAEFVLVLEVMPPVKLRVAPVLLVSEMPVLPELSVIRLLKVTVPAVLPVMFTERPALLVMTLPMLTVAVPPLMKTSFPETPVIVPVVAVKVPVQPVRLMPLVLLLVVAVSRVTASAPLVLTVKTGPVPLQFTLLTVSAPTVVPTMSPVVVSRIVKPLSVLPVASVTPLPLALEITGSVPAALRSTELITSASFSPTRVWSARSTMPPVFVPEPVRRKRVSPTASGPVAPLTAAREVNGRAEVPLAAPLVPG